MNTALWLGSGAVAAYVVNRAVRSVDGDQTFWGKPTRRSTPKELLLCAAIAAAGYGSAVVIGAMVSLVGARHLWSKYGFVLPKNWWNTPIGKREGEK